MGRFRRFLILFLFDTLGLQLAQFAHFFFAATGEAVFLELKISDLLFVDDEGVGVDQMGAGGRLVFLEQIGEFDAAFGEERHLESRDTPQTPPGIGDGLGEFAFAKSDRLQVLFEGSEMALVFGSIITGKQNRAAGGPGCYSIER